MSVKRLRWFLIVVVVELLIVIGLIVWAVVTKDDTPVDKPTTTSSQGTLTSALVASGFEDITDIATTSVESDSRLFIVEQAGTIRSVDKVDGRTITPFLDITAKVKNEGEMGLLGMAFHPRFSQNGYFFVNYVDKSQNTTISRFKVNPQGRADVTSEKVLLTIKQPYPNHNAGALAFGPDGLLYIPTGDGGSGGDPENRAQNKNELLGKILRIDVNNGDPYAIPTGNPFTDEAGTKPEIWALGLRNPWRISFDQLTGDLYIADVGQGKIEEVNVQRASGAGGRNYGWRCYEGTQTFNADGCKEASNYIAPIFEYNHDDGRCSVTGGYVYRGTSIASLKGAYIYGDYCTGEIFSAKQSGSQWEQTLILKTPYSLTTFGQDTDGEIYMADAEKGAIYRLTTR